MRCQRYYDVDAVYRRLQRVGRTHWDIEPAETHKHLFTFLHETPLPAGCRVLEVGCGGGYASGHLATRGYRVYGVDYAPTALTMARSGVREVDATLFLVADATVALPFKEDAFHAVLENHVLHCIIYKEDRANLLREMCRVLKPGGALFSANMTAEGELNYSALGIDRTTRTDYQRTRYWARASELVAEYASAGFTIERFSLEEDYNTPIACGLDAIVYAKKTA